MAMRAVLLTAGLVAVGYGAVLLSDDPPVIIARIAIWGLVAVLAHDLVIAPLCVALGFVGRWILPRAWWSPVAVAGLCSVVLVALAVPVYGKPGMRPDNATVLDRNYHAGLWISLAVGWGTVIVYLAAARFLPVRQDQRIERQCAGDVDGEPPPA